MYADIHVYCMELVVVSVVSISLSVDHYIHVVCVALTADQISV